LFKKIINIHGVPRSGTSWLGALFDSSPNVLYKYQPMYRKPLKGMIDHESSREQIDSYFKILYRYSDDMVSLEEEKRKGIHPEFEIKTQNPVYLVSKHVRHHYLIPHLLELLDNFKVVAIVRNPCAVLNSWRTTPPPTYNPAWDFAREWQFAPSKNRFRPEWYYGFHRWKEAAKLFLEMETAYPSKFYLVRYADLVADVNSCITKIFNFCKIPLEPQTRQFCLVSRQKCVSDVFGVFKGGKKIDDWKNKLDQDIVKSIYSDLIGSEFEAFL
jgi:hypothetical protein